MSEVVTDKQIGKPPEIFEPSFDAKECYTDESIEQKLNYIHEHPYRKPMELAHPNYLAFKEEARMISRVFKTLVSGAISASSFPFISMCRINRRAASWPISNPG